MTNETKLDQLFKTATSEFKNDLNPFMETRIFAEIDNQKNFLDIIFKSSFSRFIQGGVLASLIIFSVLSLQTPKKQFQGIVGQVYSINLDLKKVRKQNIAWLKIDLPNGVSLHSKNNNETKNLRTLTIPLQSLKFLNEMPIVFKSINKGGKAIQLTFLDTKKRTINTKRIQLNFTSSNELTF